MRKGEQTRQEIIRKAAPIFNQRGYDGAALSDLMKATGLEKGGIYRHFSSKEAPAAEAFDYAWRKTLHARIHDLDTISNTVDRLKQLVANFVERRGIIPGGCPLLNTAIDTDDGNPMLRERARKALIRGLAQLHRFGDPWRNQDAANPPEGQSKEARHSDYFLS
jgi:TetR/AcrR family transcriptional repressor of nem operon